MRTFDRRQFLQASAAGFLPTAASAADRPNVVVIVADDLGSEDLGCFGAKDVPTPNLDRLAARGVRFSNWHASSPVCSPSRATILTGRYPEKVGIPEILTSKPTFDVPGLRAGEQTLARELQALGYRTGAIGKWHLGSAGPSRPRSQGFDEFFGFYSGWIDYYSHRYYTLGGQPIFHDLWRNEEEVWEEPAYQTELLGREARAFIGKQSVAQPFLLYLAFGAPHYPMMAPQRYLDKLPRTMDRDRRLHAAVVMALDEAIGGVLQSLEDKKLSNTIIFFQSDNGATQEVRADHLGRPYRGGSNGTKRGWKGSLFEGGHRVAAMMNWPGKIAGGQVRDDLFAAIDLLPTLMSFCGGKPSGTVDGVDLSAALQERSKIAPRVVTWSYTGQTAASDGRWKLVVNPREGLGLAPTSGKFLYDLATDPSERNDVSSSNPNEVDRLLTAIAKRAGP